MTDVREQLVTSLRGKIDREAMVDRLKQAAKSYVRNERATAEASEKLCALIREAAAEPFSIPKTQIAKLTGLNRRSEIYPALAGENTIYRRRKKNG
jgi:hypothetical protein